MTLRRALSTMAMPLAIALTAVSAVAADEYVEADQRETQSPRAAVVFLPQTEIAVAIELGRIAPPGFGGGLLGALIMQGIDTRKQKLTKNAAAEATALVAPLVQSLDGFDVPTLAQDTSRAALAEPGWMTMGAIEFLPQVEEFDPDSVQAATLRAAAGTDAPQTAIITYYYQLAPDYTQIQVLASVQMLEQGASSPFYEQNILSIVVMDRPSFVPEENISRWSANNGALARDAIQTGFERLKTVIPAVVALDKPGFAAATDKAKPTATGGGFHGPVLMRDDQGPVIWSKRNGFVAIQRLGK